MTKRLKTGAEIAAKWRREGLIGSRPEIEDSATHARKIHEKASRRLAELRGAFPELEAPPRRREEPTFES